MNPNPRKLTAGLCLLFAILASGEDLPHPAPVLSFAMPGDVDAPVDPDLNAIAVFDDYSWRAFICHQLAGKTWDSRRARIKPKRSAIFPIPAPGSSGGHGKLITSYVNKGEWSPRSGLPSMVSPLAVICHFKAPVTRWSSVRFRISGTSIRPANGRFGGPLVAQNRTYVRFQVRLNQVEFDFIREKQLYRKWRLPAAGGPMLRFPDKSVAVKAAWRIIKEDELPAARGRYYMVDAMVLDPVTNTCKMQKMGLVGLHIVQKTPTAPAMGLVLIRAYR